MAAKYRRVNPRIWHDEKFCQLSPTAKLIALYCLTGPQSNRIGIYVLSPAAAAEDLGMVPETFREGLGNVCETLGWTFDQRCRVVYLPTWWRYQRPDNPNAFQGCLADVEDIPECESRTMFLLNETYLGETFAKRLGNVRQTFGERIAPGTGTGTGTGDKEKEKQKEEVRSKSKHWGDCDFQAVWTSWERHLSEVGKDLTVDAEMAGLYELDRFATKDAVEMVLYSLRVNAKNLIMNGDHKRDRKAKTSYSKPGTVKADIGLGGAA